MKIYNVLNNDTDFQKDCNMYSVDSLVASLILSIDINHRSLCYTAYRKAKC